MFLAYSRVVVSFDLVKIRLQDKANAGKYKNTMDCVQKIYAQEVLSWGLKHRDSLDFGKVWRLRFSDMLFGTVRSMPSN
jgi:hypothetical protein